MNIVRTSTKTENIKKKVLNRSYRVEEYNNGMKYIRRVQQQTRWSKERISELKDMAVEFIQSEEQKTKQKGWSKVKTA